MGAVTHSQTMDNSPSPRGMLVAAPRAPIPAQEGALGEGPSALGAAWAARLLPGTSSQPPPRLPSERQTWLRALMGVPGFYLNIKYYFF